MQPEINQIFNLNQLVTSFRYIISMVPPYYEILILINLNFLLELFCIQEYMILSMKYQLSDSYDRKVQFEH